MANAYKNLDRGYRSYLATQGRSINPNRAWTSYYGQYRKAQTNAENSVAGSVGTLGGTVGGSYGLYRMVGRTSRRL